MVTVHTPLDRALADWLHDSLAEVTDTHTNQLVHMLRIACDPRDGLANTTVQCSDSEVPLIRQHLVTMLQRGRAAGHPSADALAGILHYLGYTEPAPAPEAPAA